MCHDSTITNAVLFHEFGQILNKPIPLTPLVGLPGQPLLPRRRLNTQRVRRIVRNRRGWRGWSGVTKGFRSTQVNDGGLSTHDGWCRQTLTEHLWLALWQHHLAIPVRPTSVQYKRGLWNIGGCGTRGLRWDEESTGGGVRRWPPELADRTAATGIRRHLFATMLRNRREPFPTFGVRVGKALTDTAGWRGVSGTTR